MDHLPTAGIVMAERFARRHPDAIDGLVAVAGGLLPRRHGGDEEAGIEPRWRGFRRDPVAEVRDPVRGQLQALLPGQFRQPDLAADQRIPIAVEALRFGFVAGLEQGAVSVGEQHAALLEALADGGHPVAQAAAGDAEGRRGGGVREAAAQRRQAIVVGFDLAAGKDVQVGEDATAGALHHEDFDARLEGAHDQHRRRLADLLVRADCGCPHVRQEPNLEVPIIAGQAASGLAALLQSAP